MTTYILILVFVVAVGLVNGIGFKNIFHKKH